MVRELFFQSKFIVSHENIGSKSYFYNSKLLMLLDFFNILFYNYYYIFRRMYWSGLGYRPAIHTALMDGTNGKVLVKEKLKWPLGLALDAPARRLYWCDYKLGIVDSVGPDGRDRQLIRKLERGIAPTAVALHENYLYITAQSGMLYRLNKFGQGPLTVLVQGLRRPVALVVYQQQQQQVSKGKEEPCD